MKSKDYTSLKDLGRILAEKALLEVGPMGNLVQGAKGTWKQPSGDKPSGDKGLDRRKKERDTRVALDPWQRRQTLIDIGRIGLHTARSTATRITNPVRRFLAKRRKVSQTPKVEV